jgi:hypothetical protein
VARAGGSAVALPGDLGGRTGAVRWSKRRPRDWAAGVLVNNAGALLRRAFTGEIDVCSTRWSTSMSARRHDSQAAVPHLKRRQRIDHQYELGRCAQRRRTGLRGQRH